MMALYEEKCLSASEATASSPSRGGHEDFVNDCNNMLMAILGYTEMIRLSSSSPADVALFTQRIKAATERLAERVRTLSPRQDSSAPEAG